MPNDLDARLRDDMAKSALTGLISGPTMIPGGERGMAEAAYRIADAMLAERELPPFSERPKEKADEVTS